MPDLDLACLTLTPPDPDLAPSQGGRGELIFYDRPDTAGPKLSCFSITPTDDPDGLEVGGGRTRP